MAVAIEFVNVIVRKAAAEGRFPGGLDALASMDLANYLEDEHLVRIGFMSSHESLEFADDLEAAGLHYSDSQESDIAVIPWANGMTPPWLMVGECEGRKACWLKGRSPGNLINIDPCMILSVAFPSVEMVIQVLRQSGADVREQAPETKESDKLVLDCTREGARLEIEVFKDAKSGHVVGMWGRRILARRTTIEADQALMKDLTRAFVS